MHQPFFGKLKKCTDYRVVYTSPDKLYQIEGSKKLLLSFKGGPECKNNPVKGKERCLERKKVPISFQSLLTDAKEAKV